MEGDSESHHRGSNEDNNGIYVNKLTRKNAKPGVALGELRWGSCLHYTQFKTPEYLARLI